MIPFRDKAMDHFKRGKVDFLIASAFIMEHSFERAPLFEDGFQCVVYKTNTMENGSLTPERFLETPYVVTNFFLGRGKSRFENWPEQKGLTIKHA